MMSDTDDATIEQLIRYADRLASNIQTTGSSASHGHHYKNTTNSGTVRDNMSGISGNNVTAGWSIEYKFDSTYIIMFTSYAEYL